MTKKGREFNEIYDLTAMRVLVGSVKDSYGAIGIIHSLWKPLPGRFKDWIAMPKFNMHQALHTTVIGPEGRPLELQIRTQEMHETAERGIVPLHYELGSGDICEVLTSKKPRGPSRDWLSLAETARAQSKIRAWFKRERREDSERTGREVLQENFKRAGLPAQKITGSPLLADVIREMGFRKGEDFYIALGQNKISAKVVANKVMQRLRQGEAAVEPKAGEELLTHTRKEVARPTASSGTYGIKVKGIDDVPLRLAKCCRPVPGDKIAGYVSLGKGITIHRKDCPNVRALMRNPERFTPVQWEGEGATSFRVELQVDGWDRTRLLEDLSRTFAESGVNILEARCTVVHPMVKNRFVVEVGDTGALKSCIQRLRNVDSVFDAYRVTPTG